MRSGLVEELGVPVRPMHLDLPACRVKGICGKRAAMANTTTPQELEATFHTWKDALNKGDLIRSGKPSTTELRFSTKIFPGG